MTEITNSRLRINPVGDDQQEVIVNTTVNFSEVGLALMKSLRRENPNVILFVVTCDIIGEDPPSDAGRDERDNFLFRIPSKYFPREGVSGTQNLEFTKIVANARLNEDDGRGNQRDEIYAQIQVHDQYTKQIVQDRTNQIRGNF